MHANRNAARAVRHLHRRQQAIDERGLFDIPIVGPVLSGIVGGGKHSNPTPPTPPPVNPTTPSDNGNGNGNGNSGGSDKTTGNGNGNSGTTAANTGNAGGAAAAPTGSTPGTSAAAGGGGAAAGGGAVAGAGAGATSTAPQAPLPSAAIVGSTTGADGNVTPLATGTDGKVIPVATGSNGMYTAIAGGTDSGASPTGTSNPSTSPESANLSKKGLGGGAIAGILILLLIAIGLITFFLARRRSKSRRAQEDAGNHWWFGKARNDSDNESFHSGSSLQGGRNSKDRAKITSLRSSFGTNIDHGSLGIPASPPPMAEVSRQRSFGHAGETLMQGTTSRSANYPNLSLAPSSYLDNGNGNPYDEVPATPMSVRPFSPSEKFDFPKPPAPASDGRGSPPTRSITPKSNGYYTSRFSGQSFSADSTSPSSLAQTFNPIAESSGSLTEESAYSTSTGDGTLATAHEFQPTETVRRPFLPTLEDELTVNPGDIVRIVKAFDDGWCFCEKEEGADAGSRGLIPIDCLREAGQSLPAFLASKRVSSNYATWAMSEQLQTINEASA